MRWFGLRALALVFVLTAAAGGAASAAEAGLYVQDGIYCIESFAALKELSELIAQGEGAFTGEVWLMQDIAANGPMNPIGSPQNMFLGTFDGRGHEILNLRIQGDGQFMGLFGYVGIGGRVTGLTLRNPQVAGTRYTGGIAAYSAGTLQSCYVIGGRIAGKGAMEYSTAAGGIAGLSCGRIVECVNQDTLVVGRRNIGGIAGNQCAADIEGCVSTGTVRSWDRGQALAGGIAGSVQTGGEIRRCISAGAVCAPDAAWAGGIAGGLLSGKLTSCISLGTVQGREAGSVAGYAAKHAQVINCRYAPRAAAGVGEGKQAGVSEIPGGRRFGISCRRLTVPIKSGRQDA